MAIREIQFDKGNQLPLSNGVYDLDAMQLRPYRAEDYLTRRLAFPYDAGAGCPRFTAALDQYFEGDQVLIEGLQDVFGLCVSNHPSNRELFVLFGGPGTGKSTVLHVLEMLLGSFVVQLDADALSQPDSSGRVVRQLLGKRVAILSEQEQGRPLNGALIKRLSGGDKLFGREIFGKIADETNTITPSHVLIWGCNDMPAFNRRDAALRERVKVIGMHVAIPQEARRTRYWETFEPELPGILNWALEGLKRIMGKGWQTSLPHWLPSQQYTQEERNSVQCFVEQRCKREEGAWTAPTDLYNHYGDFCLGQRCAPLPLTQFVEQLKLMDIEKRSRRLPGFESSRKVWDGIACSPEGGQDE